MLEVLKKWKLPPVSHSSMNSRLSGTGIFWKQKSEKGDEHAFKTVFDMTRFLETFKRWVCSWLIKSTIGLIALVWSVEGFEVSALFLCSVVADSASNVRLAWWTFYKDAQPSLPLFLFSFVFGFLFIAILSPSGSRSPLWNFLALQLSEGSRCDDFGSLNLARFPLW